MNRWWPDGDSNAERLPLSALEHYAYCPRQAALIHLDGVFTDDVNTVLGHLAHRRVDQPAIRTTPKPGARMVTSLPVWSSMLGLYGICDAVEMTRTTAVPIEHKVGRYRAGGPADIQVAAQVVCLREILDLDVPHGEVFSHAERRRHIVAVTTELLDELARVVEATRDTLQQSTLPPAVNDRRCRGCSMLDDCLPNVVTAQPKADTLQPKPLGTWND